MAVSTKMSVDVSDFKKGMAEAAEVAKTLDAAMKANESDFRLTGDAASHYAAQLSLLNGKLEQYEKQAKLAGEALAAMQADKNFSETDKAYQAMLRTYADAQTAVNNTKNEILQLQEAASQLGGSFSLEDAIKSIDQISSGLEKAVNNGKKFLREVAGAGDWAEDIKQSAEIYNLTNEQYQRMSKTAEYYRTDIEAIYNAWERLTKDAGKGEKSILTAMGIDTQGKSSEDLFWEVSDALMSISNQEERNRKANEIFGASWEKLMPILKAGRQEFEEISEKWSVLSDDQLGDLTDFYEKYKTIELELETKRMELLSGLSKPLGWLMSNETEIVSAISGISGALTSLQVSKSVLEFMKLFKDAKSLFGGGGGNGTGGNGSPTLVSRILSAAGPLGLTAALGLAPAFLSLAAANAIPDTAKLNNSARVLSSDATKEEVEALREYVSLRNEAAQLEDKLGTGEFDENRYNELYDRLDQLTHVTEGDLWSKYWDYVVSNNMMEGEWQTDVLDNMISSLTGGEGVPVTVAPVAEEGAAASIAAQVGTVTIPAVLSVSGEGPGYANGLPYVPSDGLYRLHRGERVMTAREARSNNFSSNLYVENMNMNGGLSADALAAAIAGRNRRIMTGYGS